MTGRREHSRLHAAVLRAMWAASSPDPYVRRGGRMDLSEAVPALAELLTELYRRKRLWFQRESRLASRAAAPDPHPDCLEGEG